MKAYYGKYGSLLLDEAHEDAYKLRPVTAADYGKPYLMGESLSEEAARKLADAYGFEWGGVIK